MRCHPPLYQAPCIILPVCRSHLLGSPRPDVESLWQPQSEPEVLLILFTVWLGSCAPWLNMLRALQHNGYLIQYLSLYRFTGAASYTMHSYVNCYISGCKVRLLCRERGMRPAGLGRPLGSLPGPACTCQRARGLYPSSAGAPRSASVRKQMTLCQQMRAARRPAELP